MEHILELYGFKHSSTCSSCNGYRTIKYRRAPDDGYELQWRIKRHLFRLKRYGNATSNWINFEEIKLVLEGAFGPTA